MARFALHEVEYDVNQAIERLAEKLVSSKYRYIIGSVRRLPRIFDAALTDGPLRSALNQKLVYPSCAAFSPKMFADCSAAVVDDCVQRGISIRGQLDELRELGVRDVTLFALATSRWHVRHGQFTGVHIHEPVLNLQPNDFSVVSSYVNDLLRECSIPLDCDDRFIEVRRHNDSTPSAVWLAKCAKSLGAIDALPAPAYSKIRRYSQFLGIDHPAVQGLRTIETPQWRFELDEEVKLLWSIGQEGKIYCVPIALLKMKRSPSFKVDGDVPSPLRTPLSIFRDCTKESLALNESVVLWCSATIAGFLQATFRACGDTADLEPNKQEFFRAYGVSGQAIYDWYVEQLQIASSRTRESSRAAFTADQLPTAAFHENGLIISNLLLEHYKSKNAHVHRLNWTPKGLSFSEIRSRISPSLTAAHVSAVLDHLLANCWIKTSTVLVNDTAQTRYFATELPPDGHTAVPDEKLTSFSRSADWLKIRHSRLLCQAVAEQFVEERAKESGVLLGHFEHALSSLIDALGKDKKDTVFAHREYPHGVVVVCDTHNALVHGEGTIEQNQESLGIHIQNGRVRPRRVSREQEDTSAFASKALLLIREVHEAASTLSRETQCSTGDAILYLSSCLNARTLFPAILANVRMIRDSLAPIAHRQSLTESQKSTIGHCLSGASDKLRLAAQSEPLVDILCRVAKRSQMSALFREFVGTSDKELGANGWLAILEQLIAEAKVLFLESRIGNRTLFEDTHDEPWSDCQYPEVQSIWGEWSEQIGELGFLAESDFKLPFEKLQHRFVPCDLQGTVGFVKIDAARYGQPETAEKKSRREEVDFPLFRSVAGFYHGVEARDPEGDAVMFAFSKARNALRFAHAATLMCDQDAAVAARYRITAVYGLARFMEDGNIDSSSLDVIPDIESFLKNLHPPSSSHGARLGSLIDDGLWCVVKNHLKTKGMNVGASSYIGKREVPGLIFHASFN